MQDFRKLAILLFEDVELLDFAGPYEVFSTANRQATSPLFEIYTVAESAGPVRSHNGLSVVPQITMDQIADVDLLLVPGGIGTRKQLDNAALQQWIANTAAGAELVMSVCTGALLLAKAGLLDGLSATTHKVGFELLAELSPTTRLERDRRFVDCGQLVTSAGIAAGIDMSLHVVSRLAGGHVGQATAEHMEYPYFEKRV